MGHLFWEDLIWSTAIVSNQKLKLHSEFPEIHWDEYLQDLLSTGIFDHIGEEHQDNTKEKFMRYAAVCTSFVFDHVTTLEQKVMLKIFFIEFSH